MPSTRWFALLLLLIVPVPVRAAWFDAAWPCRRTVDVAWNADQAVGNELAQAEVYTDGRSLPTAADVRVTADDGKPVPFHLLGVGPGDRVRLVFAMRKDVKRYAVYFGNPTPPADPTPPPWADVPRSGLLMETKPFTGGGAHTFEQLRHAWDHGGPSLGQTMVPHPFIGFNPFGDQVPVVSQLTGTLYAPIDGDYVIAMAVDDEGAIYVDDKPAVLAHLGAADTRYRATVHLTIGPHPFTLYHVNLAGTGYVSVGWQRPDGRKSFAVIDKGSFGNLYAGENVTVGPLEVKGKALVADFAADRQAECWVGPGDDDYVFHYRFTGSAKAGVPVVTRWDFGDGRRATGTTVDHVYLRPGVYAVRCAAAAGENEDVQTCRVVVGRDYLHLPVAKAEPATIASAQLAKPGDLADVPAVDLPHAVRTHLEAGQLDLAVAAASALAASPSPPNDAVVTLSAVDTALMAAHRPDDAIALWDRVPTSGDARPSAARRAGQLALWWSGDAKRAVTLLAPFKSNGRDQLTYALALLLAGHADDARAILETAPAKATGARRAALSGADARTVEFYITEGEPDAGDAAWDRWMANFPTDYLTGYSVLLRTKLMQLHGRDAAAAAVAEAFADAVPNSSYAPQLLDRAAKLLAKTDPDKSAAVRQRLKQKYPEDPLSQN